MDSNIKTINIAIELCGALMCLTGIAAVLIGRRMEKKTSRYFRKYSAVLDYIFRQIFVVCFLKADLML